MIPQKKSWQEYLVEAKQEFKKANHLAYVTLTLLKENRLIIKILVDLHKVCTNLVKAFLAYEEQKGLRLYKDPMKNLELFFREVAPKYMDETESQTILKILKVAKNHKDSHLEFVKREKFVIMLGDKYETLTVDSIKSIISSLSRVISRFPLT